MQVHIVFHAVTLCAFLWSRHLRHWLDVSESTYSVSSPFILWASFHTHVHTPYVALKQNGNPIPIPANLSRSSINGYLSAVFTMIKFMFRHGRVMELYLVLCFKRCHSWIEINTMLCCLTCIFGKNNNIIFFWNFACKNYDRWHYVMMTSNWVGVILKRTVGFNSTFRSVCSHPLLENVREKRIWGW